MQYSKTKFIDEINILVKGGDGGHGYVTKYKTKSNFNYKKQYYSNGGNGGDVYISANKNINSLNKFKFQNKFYANKGQNGKKYGCTGKKGKNINIQVPVGTQIIDKHTNKLIGYLTQHKAYLIVAKGGYHGLGNTTSNVDTEKLLQHRNIKGQKGEERFIKLNLILIAKVGMFGLPNSGKSTLITAISTTKSKIACYPFTTLSPTLGIVNINHNSSFTIIDLPGLIKGSCNNAGLGVNFLKHLKHCKILLHIIDISSQSTTNITKNILIINNEINSYDTKLLKKPCWLIFNKIDKIEINKAKNKAKNIASSINYKTKYLLISAVKHYGIHNLCKKIINFIKD